MNAETRWNIDAKTMIAAPFAINPARLTDEARALWDSEVLQSIIAERMAKGARKEGHTRGLPPTIKDAYQTGGNRPFALLPGPARIMLTITDEWETYLTIQEKIGGGKANTLESLRRLVEAGRIEVQPRVGSTPALYRRAQA